MSKRSIRYSEIARLLSAGYVGDMKEAGHMFVLPHSYVKAGLGGQTIFLGDNGGEWTVNGYDFKVPLRASVCTTDPDHGLDDAGWIYASEELIVDRLHAFLMRAADMQAKVRQALRP